MTIAPSAIILGDVRFLGQSNVEDGCIIGCGPEGSSTVFGDDAIIRAGTYIYSGNKIGRKFRTGNKANIREDNEVGNNVSIGTLSVIEHHVTIGDNVRIHTQVFIPEYSIIGPDVWIGPNVVLINARYPNNALTKSKLQGPHLGAGCIIGANTTILPGIKIGEGALVGAGSVVTKDIAPNTVFFGNPARPFGKTTDIEDYNRDD